MGVSEALAVLRQVAAALDYAHWSRVTHGDVRPENVMIDGEGWVKVLDFGLSEVLRTSGGEPYMAPELWEGHAQSPESDQYALGVMAYEMLAGHLPFERTSSARLKDAVLNGEVRSISGIPDYAIRALRRALAKRDEERFRSCVSFMRALAGRGRRRKGGAQSLMVWVTVLVLLGVGALLGRGRVMKMVRRTFPPKQEVGQDAIAETGGTEKAALLPEEVKEEEPAAEIAGREATLSQEERSEVAAGEPPAPTEEERPLVASSGSPMEMVEKATEMPTTPETTQQSVIAPTEATEMVADAGGPPALPGETGQDVASSEVEPEHAQVQEPTAEEQDAAARGERMGRRLVQAAVAYRDAKQWTKCLAAAEAALSADPENAEAKALKTEAEGKLRPRIALQATLDGKKVRATVTKGMAHAGRTTPIMVNIRKGGVYGFVAEYETDGKKYVGRTVVEAKEQGVTGAVIVLREVGGARGAQ